MSNKPLQTMRVAILATDMVEEAELIEPRKALEEAGATTELIAPHSGEIVTANHDDKSTTYPVDVTLEHAKPTEYDAVLLPGGALNADAMRAEPYAQSFLQKMDAADKPIAFICHAPWELISAGIAEGRRMTGYHTIADDVINAGADWVDQQVVVDDNWVSSRRPSDIPAFNTAMIDLFSQARNVVLT
jgi:protease I